MFFQERNYWGCTFEPSSQNRGCVLNMGGIIYCQGRGLWVVDFNGGKHFTTVKLRKFSEKEAEKSVLINGRYSVGQEDTKTSSGK